MTNCKAIDEYKKATKSAELYSNLVCALTHDIKVCDQCQKCKGDNSARIRMELVRDLANIMSYPVPWIEQEGE